jgi:hypothetical protein
MLRIRSLISLRASLFSLRASLLAAMGLGARELGAIRRKALREVIEPCAAALLKRRGGAGGARVAAACPRVERGVAAWHPVERERS